MYAKIRELRKQGQDIILDGFPRDLYQAKWVAAHLASDISQAIVLDVPKDELLVRIMARGRTDDTREAIERRFDIVEKNLRSILKELSAHGVKTTQLSGLGSINTVTKRLERQLFHKNQKIRKFKK